MKERGKEEHQGLYFGMFDHEYLVEFLAPVTCLVLTICSIVVELYQVINLCLDFSDEDEEI